MALSMGRKPDKPKIPMDDVKSSTVKSVGYDAPSRTLAVQFASGGTYHYHGVAPEVHTSLMKAESIGKFLHNRVKGKYGHKKA